MGYEWPLDMRSTSAPWHESTYPAEHHEARREDTEDLQQHKAERKAWEQENRHREHAFRFEWKVLLTALITAEIDKIYF